MIEILKHIKMGAIIIIIVASFSVGSLLLVLYYIVANKKLKDRIIRDVIKIIKTCRQ